MASGRRARAGARAPWRPAMSGLGGLLPIAVLAGFAWPAAAQTAAPGEIEGRCTEKVQFELGERGRLRRAKAPERVIMEGGARLFRCDQMLEAPRIVGYLRDGQTLYRADMPGRARLVRGDQVAEAGWAVVDFDQDLATLGGGVTLDTAAVTLRCDRVEADLTARRVYCQGVTGPMRARLRPSREAGAPAPGQGG